MQNNLVVKLSLIFVRKWYADDDTNKEGLETYVQKNVDKYLGIARRLQACENNLLTLQKQFNASKESLRSEQRDIWKECDHPVKTYHPDPSGNNDSHYECCICGKEI